MEEFQRTPEGMAAVAAVRMPNTTVSSHDLELDDAGTVTRYAVEERDPDADSLVRRVVYAPEEDSMVVEVTESGAVTTRRIERHPGMLPFVDMAHWPFEIMLTRARRRRTAWCSCSLPSAKR